MTERTITLRYGGRCRACGTSLSVGQRGRWSPDTHHVRCESCPSAVPRSPHDPVSPNGSRGQSRARRGPEQRKTASDPSQTRSDAPAGKQRDRTSREPRLWPTLLRYHHEAVRRASVCDPVPFVRRGDWVVLPELRETLLTGRGDDLGPSSGLTALFDKLEQGEEVFVGWPLLVMPDTRGQRQIAPLFMTRLEAPDTPGGRPVAADDDPYLNPAITVGGEFFALESIVEAESHLPSSGLLPFTDPPALVELANRMLHALGFDQFDLDIDHLNQTPPGDVGVHNSMVAVRGTGSAATAGLLKELLQLQRRDDWNQTAAQWLLKPAPAEEDHGNTPLNPSPLHPLSDGQQQAASMAATARLTAVKGPPGTGKSELVATIVADAWGRGESVLVASTNNGAVEVAVERCQSIDKGVLIRAGNKVVREALPGFIEQLVERVREPAPSPEVTRRRLRTADTRRRAIIAAIAERSRLDAALAQAVLDRDEAATVLWGQPRPPAALTGRHAGALRRARRMEVAPWLFPQWRLARLRRAIGSDGETDAADVVEWARTAEQFDKLHKEYLALGPDAPDLTYAELAAADEEWGQASRAVLTPKVHESLRTAAVALRQLAQSRSGGRDARVAAAENALAHGARGWACTARSIQANFPLRAALFDLVVVDEASQCGVADLIPLAYRARRLVVIGDPNQLAPVVKLTEVQLRALAAAGKVIHDNVHSDGLSAAGSAFAAVTTFSRAPNPPVPVLLDEHRRCHPDIAAFCNQQFYGGALQILTDTNGFDAEPRGLAVIPVTGTMQSGQNGASWVNDAEVIAAVDWLVANLETASSIGVVTPFKAQRQAIEDELIRRVGRERAETIAVGTVHTFQGGQRDVMLFSPALAGDAPDGTVKWIEDNRHLINVAVSRAKRALIVVSDPGAIAALAAPTLIELLRAAGRSRDTTAAIGPRDELGVTGEQAGLLHSRSEAALYAALRARGVSVELKPVVQGYELDFALRTPTGPVDIECDGAHHQDARGRQRRQDLARDAIIKRAGWTVARYPSWRCLTAPDEVVSQIVADAGLLA